MADDGVVRAAVRALIGMLLATVAPEYLREDVEVTVRSASGRRLWAASIHPNQLAEGGAPGPPDGARGSARRVSHSPDFRSYTWGQERYSFTPGQAAVVRALQEAKDNGTPDVGQDTLMEVAGSEGSRLRDLFKSHPAWGNLIVRGDGKGTLRLADPE
jgi:hypothetical protein